MPILNEQQRKRALEVMQEYLQALHPESGIPLPEAEAEFDSKRRDAIDNHLKPLLLKYFFAKIPLAKFKSDWDGFNKRQNYWGFSGPKGQMFFNLLFNNADSEPELDDEVKAVLIAPQNDQVASSRMKTFASYVKRIRQQVIESGKNPNGAPNPGSIPFFLSYFWQIQSPEVWPVYYTNSVRTLSDLNIWNPSDDAAADYLAFKEVHEELRDLFSKGANRPFTFYDVEHVFWFKGRPKPAKTEATVKEQPSAVKQTSVELNERLPESFVPPVISILPAMARHEDWLVEAAKRSGTSLDRAFEKNIDAAFTILGFETKLMGQGQGRVPDGRALAADDNYALLWDAKIRTNSYSLGTDDRTIREYIKTQSRELSRRYRNIYYVIISSSFADDFDEAIASMKMETEVSEVVLLEAEALVALVEAKIRSPLELSLGPDGIQRLLTRSGALTFNMVSDFLA